MEENKKLIMLVDDSPANLRIGKNLLADKYIVATIPSAAKLFSLIEHNTPSLILLDVDMPEMNGYEAIKILKDSENTKNIPVIFLTAHTEHAAEEKAFSLGAAAFISKPFHKEYLLDCIEEHIKK
ncbi:MAG: response regulator [Treponema sp.]|nr:response regulator [Treponema sp.]